MWVDLRQTTYLCLGDVLPPEASVGNVESLSRCETL